MALSLFRIAVWCAACYCIVFATISFGQWAQQTDMMFGHYKGPPELVVSASRFGGAAVFGTLLGLLLQLVSIIGHKRKSKKDQRYPSNKSSVIAVLVWGFTFIMALLVFGAASAELPYAKLQLQRDAMDSVAPGEKNAVDVVAALKSDDALTRYRAAEAMTRVDVQIVIDAMPQLLELIETGDEVMSVSCINAVARLGPDAEAAIPTLLNALDTKNSLGVRVAADKALVGIGTPAVLAIEKELDGGDEAFQQMLPALQQFPELSLSTKMHVKVALASPDASTRNAAINIWQKSNRQILDPEYVTAVTASFEEADDQSSIRRLSQLKQAGWRAYRAVPKLEGYLDSPNLKQRLTVAETIWAISGRSDYFLDVTGELLEKDPIAALVRLDGMGPVAAKHLNTIESLESHEDRGVSQRAEMAASRIKRESRYSVVEIRNLLSSNNAIHEIEKGLYQVEIRGDLVPELIPEVRTLVYHHHQGIQRRALGALVRMGPAAYTAISAVETIIKFGDQQTQEIASSVLIALQQLYGPSDTPSTNLHNHD